MDSFGFKNPILDFLKKQTQVYLAQCYPNNKMKANRKETRVELTEIKPETFCFTIYSVLCLSGLNRCYLIKQGHEMSQKKEGPSRLSLQVTTFEAESLTFI